MWMLRQARTHANIKLLNNLSLIMRSPTKLNNRDARCSLISNLPNRQSSSQGGGVNWRTHAEGSSYSAEL